MIRISYFPNAIWHEKEKSGLAFSHCPYDSLYPTFKQIIIIWENYFNTFLLTTDRVNQHIPILIFRYTFCFKYLNKKSRRFEADWHYSLVTLLISFEPSSFSNEIEISFFNNFFHISIKKGTLFWNKIEIFRHISYRIGKKWHLIVAITVLWLAELYKIIFEKLIIKKVSICWQLFVYKFS